MLVRQLTESWYRIMTNEEIDQFETWLITVMDFEKTVFPNQQKLHKSESGELWYTYPNDKVGKTVYRSKQYPFAMEIIQCNETREIGMDEDTPFESLQEATQIVSYLVRQKEQSNERTRMEMAGAVAMADARTKAAQQLLKTHLSSDQSIGLLNPQALGAINIDTI